MVAEADAESAGSGQLPHSSEKRFLTLGRAETKKLAKKGREQRQKRKRKAEGLLYTLYNYLFFNRPFPSCFEPHCIRQEDNKTI